jgi:hypothetical protein
VSFRMLYIEPFNFQLPATRGRRIEFSTRLLKAAQA